MRQRTHGKYTVWGIIALQHVCDETKIFWCVFLVNSKQHMDMKDTTVKRNNQDCKKTEEIFKQHNPCPFPILIISVNTGLENSRILSPFEFLFASLNSILP